MRMSRNLLLFTILTLLLSPLSGRLHGSAFERPPTLPASALVPASLISGSGFHVVQQVPTDGLMAHFTIHSDVGTFKANSIEMLKIRVAEIPAIQELTKTSKSKVFEEALATNAARPVTAAAQMATHPVDTVKGLPSGVGRFFGRVELGAQRLKEAATEPANASTGQKAQNFATKGGQAARNVFGYEQERRELAKKMHVDPYTTNPILSKQLDDFALVAFRAHVGVTTTMAVFIPGSMAITATRVVSTWVWDTPKADLIVKDQKGLERLKVPQRVIQTFMKNPVFPLSVQTEFVANLERLSGVPGSIDAVKLASTATSEVQARFLTGAVGMLARYHETQTPITRLIVRRAIIGQDRTGAIVVQAPVDYVSWTELVSNFAHRPELQKSKRTIWITGQFSSMARENFRALGWTINDKVNPLPGSSSGPE
jgi:hypothetical protein